LTRKSQFTSKISPWYAFWLFFGFSIIFGGLFGSIQKVNAAPKIQPAMQEGAFAGSQSCQQCHENIHEVWKSTRHAHAFSSPIFQRDWSEQGAQVACLECHTTGFNPETGTYAEEGITCESCHGPFQPDHPAKPMPITPNEQLCAKCHKSTTDEWHASVHSQAGINCQACHNPHSQTQKAATVTELCANCHKERGSSFTHSTHANAGLECSNCHMYTSPRTTDPIQGLVPTGHTFFVGSDACIGCHQDTVHTRDQIMRLSGEVEQLAEVDVQTLEQTVINQQQEIIDLQAQSKVRLYTGLIQGAIVGLITGGVAAFIISRGIKVVEVEEEDNGEEKES